MKNLYYQFLSFTLLLELLIFNKSGNKRYSSSKFLTAALFLTVPFLVKATNYTSAASGNWSSSSTWSPSGVPSSGDNVTIANTITLDVNESVNNITINSSETFTVSGSNTLTVYGNFTNNGTFTYSTGTVVFAATSGNQTISGSGTIAFYNLTANPSAVSDTLFLNKVITVNNNLTISQGVLDCETYKITGNSSGTMTMALGTTLVLGLPSSSTLPGFPSNYTNANISLNVASTVLYQADNTTSGQTVSSVPYYGNVIVTTSNAGTSTVSSLFYVRGTLNINSPVTFSSNTTTDSIKGNLTISSGATYKDYSTKDYLFENLINNGTYKGQSGNICSFVGNTNQTVSGPINVPINTWFNGMTFDPTVTTDSLFIEANISAVYDFGTIVGTMFVPATYNDTIEIGDGLYNGGTFTALNGVCYFYAKNYVNEGVSVNPATFYKLTVNNIGFYVYTNIKVTSDFTRTSGALDFSSSNLYLQGDYINNTSTAPTGGGTTIMTGAHNQTIRGSAYPVLASLQIDQAAANDTVKLADSLSCFALTITQGVFDVTPSNYNVTINENLVDNGTFLTRNGLITFNGNVYGNSISIGGTMVPVFNNLILDPYSTATLTNNIIVKGNLSVIQHTFDVSTSNYSLRIGGNFTNNGTFTERSGTVNLNGSTNQTLSGTGSLTFYNLTQKQATSTDSVFIGKAITVSHNFADSTGVFGCQTYQLTGNSTGTMTMAANTNMLLGQAGSSTNVAFPTTFTTAHTTLNAASTVSYLANTAQTISTTPTYGNLVLGSGASSTRKTPASSPLAIAGNLNIGNNTTLVANTGAVNLTGNLTNRDSLIFTTGALNIGGSFTNNGTFVYGTGTVTLNGNSGQTIGGSSSTTFYNLTGTSTGTETITLGNNESVSNNLLISLGTFALTGASYNLNIAGNLTNNSSLTASSGTIIMNGSSNQTIGGSAASKFYNLTINGSSSRIVSLGNNQLVTQNLNINTGSLNTSTYHIN